MGDYAEAMRLFERATQINEEVLRPSNPESARASWFIPDLLPLSGYGSEDADLFERVLANRESTRGLADPRTAESLSNLAAVLSSADDYRRTRPLFERALEAQERFLGPDHPEVAASATNLAQRAVADWRRRSGEAALRARAGHLGEGAGTGSSEGGHRAGESRAPPPENRKLRDAGPLLDRALPFSRTVWVLTIPISP